jgi:cell wall-associated NlpC family hydrolase
MANKGAAIAVGATGVVLFYAALSGQTILGTVKDIISGKKPPSLSNTPATGLSASSGFGTGGAGSGSAIAADALQYVGHGYVYGGPSNPNGGWDCSSFVSYVLGHDLSYKLPGGSWAQITSNGTSHGPVAAQYLVWSGAKTIPRVGVQAGDLLCWETHVGFAADSNQMISALDSVSGTCVSDIAGPTGEVLVCRRINGVT